MGCMISIVYALNMPNKLFTEGLIMVGCRRRARIELIVDRWMECDLITDPRVPWPHPPTSFYSSRLVSSVCLQNTEIGLNRCTRLSKCCRQYGAKVMATAVIRFTKPGAPT